MEILNKIRTYISSIANAIFFIVILVLLIIIQFKNNKIGKLEKALLEKPKIEFINKVETEYIVDTVLQPTEIIKYREKVLVPSKDTVLDISKADSASIAAAYNSLYKDYNSVRYYDSILKNDSLAFIQVREKVSNNNLLPRWVRCKSCCA